MKLRIIFFFTILCYILLFEPDSLMAEGPLADEVERAWSDSGERIGIYIPWAKSELPALDFRYLPKDPKDVFWLCFKSHHMLIGLDVNKRIVFSACRVAIGACSGQKQRRGDMRTPEGVFSIKDIEDASHWEPYRDGRTGERIGYGPWFIRLETGRWRGIGIHGTDSEHDGEIGTDASHGCIRMHNEELLETVKLARPGQRVIIVSGGEE